MKRNALAGEDLGAHARYLRGYAMRQLGDADVADDLVQETFVAALRSDAAFQGRSSLRTWLVAILKHKILDEYRRRAHAEVSLDALLGDEEEGLPGADKSWLPAGEGLQPGEIAGPEQALARAQFWHALQRHLARLSGKAARTFVLADVLGHSTPEICATLQTSPAAVWTTMHRVRKVLRAELAE
jgi:RNA polymerase sigma-70 factor (ECF subfamily)